MLAPGFVSSPWSLPVGGPRDVLSRIPMTDVSQDKPAPPLPLGSPADRRTGRPQSSRRPAGARRLGHGRVPRYWRYRLAPDPLKRRPKGILRFWTRARRLLWSWWPWTAAFLYAMVQDRWGWAAGMGAMGVVSYLIAPSEFPPRFGLDHEFPVEDPEFLSTVAGATGVPFAPGNRLEILNNGNAFYPVMLDAIRKAQLSITVEAYIYWAGEIGKEFAAELSAKAEKGVKVKLLLDAVGSSTLGGDILEILERGGCQLAWYNPLRWYSIGRFNRRTHRKSLIIDGRVGFTGGAGFADHWKGDAEDPEHWRDMQVRLEGPAVTPLQTGFAQNWLETTGELISGPIYYPPPAEPAGSLAVQTILSSPQIGTSTVRTMYYLSIICARRSIYIANPYFVPDETALDALVDAKKRGVDVRVMVSGTHNDNWLARQNSVRLFGPLLRAGIEVQEYNRTMLHHKTMVVDALWATIGTTNFDNRSFAHNEENNVCFFDAGIARAMHGTFLADLKGCDRVTLDGWRRRGAVRKAGEVLAAFLQEQA